MSPFSIFGNPIFDFDPETLLVPLIVFGGLDVQGIVEVEQIREERAEAPDHVLQPPSGGPTHAVDRALPENAETDVAFFADIWMPKSGQAFDLGRGNVIVFADVYVKPELAAHPEALIRGHDQGEVV